MWVTAYILKRGRKEYRVSIIDVPTNEGWAIEEEHAVSLDASTDLPSLQRLVDQLCERPLSYEQARKVLADLRGQVLGRPVTRMTDKYATILLRGCARILDGLLFMPFGFISLHALTSSPVWARIVAFVVSSSAFLVYRIVMHGTLGQTLGKMATGVIVRDLSEQPLSMRQAVLRDIAGVVLLPVTLVVYIPLIVRGVNPFRPEHMPALHWQLGYLTFGWSVIDVVTVFANRKRRALHDFIAGSVVVRMQPDDLSQLWWWPMAVRRLTRG